MSVKSEREYQRKRGDCRSRHHGPVTWKVAYKAQGKAESEAIRLTQVKREMHQAYVCPRCGHWHVGRAITSEATS